MLRTFSYAKIIGPLLALLLTAAGCGGDELYSNDYRCDFRFNTAVHNNTLIQQVVNPLVPGYYVMIGQTTRGGVRQVTLRLGGGATETVPITTAEELLHVPILGAGGTIVVGHSYHYGLLAFDGQCPNCLQETGNARHPLAFGAAGWQMTCARCGRAYDLNERGVVVKGPKGRKMMEYVARLTGRLLLVHNKY